MGGWMGRGRAGSCGTRAACAPLHGWSASHRRTESVWYLNPRVLSRKPCRAGIMTGASGKADLIMSTDDAAAIHMLERQGLATLAAPAGTQPRRSAQGC